MFETRTFDKEIKSMNSKLRDLKQKKKEVEEKLSLFEKKKKRLSSGLAVMFGANKSKSYKECEENLKNARKQLDDLNCTISEINLLKKETKSIYNDAIKLYERAVENKFDEALLQQSAELGYDKAVKYFEEKEIKRILKEEKKRIKEEEKRKTAEIESRFQKIISGEIIDRDELKSIADSGYVNAMIVMAKLLIDDYFSDIYTSSEKKDKISDALTYLYEFQNEGNELEFLYRFCDSVIYKNYLKGQKEHLKRIREIKSAGALSQKYDELAEKTIRIIVKQIDDLECKEIEEQQTKKESVSYYSYSTSNDDSSSSLCAHYQNGCCKHGYNSAYNNISCDYSEHFQDLCPYFQER